MTTDTAAPWRAWFRAGPRQRWRQIAEAVSEAEAWTAALNYALPGDKTVTSPGRDPNQERGADRRHAAR